MGSSPEATRVTLLPLDSYDSPTSDSMSSDYGEKLDARLLLWPFGSFA